MPTPGTTPRTRRRPRRAGRLLLATALALGAGGVGTASAVTAPAGATPAPAAAPKQPVTAGTSITAHDRVYTADQSSNTVTVIDPSTDKTLGTIALGDQRLGTTLSPQYTKDVDVHGLAASRDGRRLGVVSVTSGTVDVVDTATNRVLNSTDVGLASHEGTFTADGSQFWVADRGRTTLDVVDAVHGGVIAQVPAGQGPSKVVLSPDGKTAYVNHIAEADVSVIDVATRRTTATIGGIADTFSSDEAISPDGTQLWVSNKRTGQLSVVDLVHRKVIAVLASGPDTNHPNFVTTPAGTFAYVGVGGLDVTKVYRLDGSAAPRQVASVHDHGHAPHGVWGSADGTRVYVGLEKSDGVDVIDTRTNRVIDTIGIGQEPQALVFVQGASPNADAPNLGRQGLGQQAHDVATVLPGGGDGEALDPVAGRHLEATIRPVNGLDMIQLQARGLAPNTTYLADSVAANGTKTPVVTFTTDAKGNDPMVLAFSIFSGRRISLQTTTSAPVQPAADAMHDTGTPGIDPALAFCCC